MPDEIITREGHTIRTEDLSWLPLEFLLFNMRDVDKRDMFGQCPSENPLEIAYAIMHAEKLLGWVIKINGRPSGALGVYQVHPGNWAIWSLGIDRPDVALLILERIFEGALPHIRKHGGWSIRCKTRFDHGANRTNLRLLGFKVEAVLKNYGTDRSTFLQYVFHLEDEVSDEQPVNGEARSLRSPAMKEASHVDTEPT